MNERTCSRDGVEECEIGEAAVSHHCVVFIESHIKFSGGKRNITDVKLGLRGINQPRRSWKRRN